MYSLNQRIPKESDKNTKRLLLFLALAIVCLIPSFGAQRRISVFAFVLAVACFWDRKYCRLWVVAVLRRIL
jgi:hypothetical protein